jgi:aminoglycoside/choline kinase family phosphotransferase
MIAFSREALGLPLSVPVRLSALKKRGSDRAYFRLEWGSGQTAILVRYDPRRVENTYHADIAAFLADIGIPVPRVAGHDEARCLIVMEDLGDIDLWSLARTPWETRSALYRKTLSVAHRLHSFPTADFPSARVKLMDGFGPDLYRWERDYFREHFVRGICGIDLDPRLGRKLEEELSGLAERLAGTTTCLVHRDLQSQNVMIRDGEPFLIDFQGMRPGSASYDLASLLCDPYAGLSDDERDDLLSYYYGLSGTGGDRSAFRDRFWEASAQRLMQALGAYGFLGRKSGLDAFLAHIPAGLDNLIRAAGNVPSLPLLLALAGKCRDISGKGR